MNKYLVMVSLTAVLAACGEKSEQAQTSAEIPNTAEQARTTLAAEPVPPVDKAVLVEQAKAAVQALAHI